MYDSITIRDEENDVLKRKPRSIADDLYDDKRIPQFERYGVAIVGNEDSINEKHSCDDFEHPIECTINSDNNICLHCLETANSLRLCMHISEDLEFFDVNLKRNIKLPKNRSVDRGYCLRDRLVGHISDLQNNSSKLALNRETCSPQNADWILTKQSLFNDSSYSFVCKCKYPHLLTNYAGPYSSCSFNTACNGHGTLDDESLAGRIDPFLHGRCICEEGWISEKNNHGPYCREGKFQEIPSFYYPKESNINRFKLQENEAIEPRFVEMINARRLDKHKDVWLPDPCIKKGCTLTKNEINVMFCMYARIISTSIQRGNYSRSP